MQLSSLHLGPFLSWYLTGSEKRVRYPHQIFYIVRNIPNICSIYTLQKSSLGRLVRPTQVQLLDFCCTSIVVLVLLSNTHLVSSQWWILIYMIAVLMHWWIRSPSDHRHLKFCPSITLIPSKPKNHNVIMKCPGMKSIFVPLTNFPN